MTVEFRNDPYLVVDKMEIKRPLHEEILTEREISKLLEKGVIKEVEVLRQVLFNVLRREKKRWFSSDDFEPQKFD